MQPRILFVDDDQMLLSSMERCLGLEFDLVTAISGLEALKKIEEQPTFPVVVCDMRMPVMDGLQFIERARELSKRSVFLMLTGNQDVQTAVRAVNEGQVYRFLNKPCDPEEIAFAIRLGLQQYELEDRERDLLNKTFVGAVGIFGDVMETLQPELLGRTADTEQFVELLREQISAPPRWEFKIASKLALLGVALQRGSCTAKPTSQEGLAHLSRVCETSAKMVEKIPRMDLVAQIIRLVPVTDADLDTVEPRGEGDVARLGAALLRVGNLVEGMVHFGVDSDTATADIQSLLPGIYPPLLKAAKAVYPENSAPSGVSVEVEDLKPGMVLQEDLYGAGGATLLRAGRHLSETHIAKLHAENQTPGKLSQIKVTVTVTSFEASRDDSPAAATT